MGREHTSEKRTGETPPEPEGGFTARRSKALEVFKKKPTMEARDRTLEVRDGIDYLVGREQASLRAAEEYLAYVRAKEYPGAKEQFESEQKAAKRVAYWAAKVEWVTRYAELKRDHPDLASEAEGGDPPTTLLRDTAAHEWMRISGQNNKPS